ncbi:MAG: histidine--tRNA ligase [Candidatus Omnitrophota bacterium]
MSMLFKSPRGTKDLLPQESRIWQEAEDKARKVFSNFAYEEIRTPLIEEAKLFSRSLGELTDIVQKHMFVIKRETDTFVLRPEATASIIRAYVEHTLYYSNPVSKFYYMGPMFRAERPQKGRLRQFHHIGCEAIGSTHPYLDAEVIFLATRLIEALGIGGYAVELNTLGCLEDKKNFARQLKEKVAGHAKSFCEDCQERMGRNIFRVLDCKHKQCQEIIASLRLGRAHLCGDCRKHFQDVEAGLSLFGVGFKTVPLLVRGLDYYTRTVFEITHPGLGSQDALGAGGRYDHLVEELGGPKRGAVGFALGMERLLLAKGEAGSVALPNSVLDCYLIALGESALKKVLSLVRDLRAAGISAEVDYLEGSLKAKLRRADKMNPKYCLILGDDELAKGICLLKDMRQGTQEEVVFSNLIHKIKGGK